MTSSQLCCRGCRRDDDEISAAQQQQLAWRFARALAAGGPGAHGGCTDASVRLSHLIKVESIIHV